MLKYIFIIVILYVIFFPIPSHLEKFISNISPNLNVDNLPSYLPVNLNSLWRKMSYWAQRAKENPNNQNFSQNYFFYYLELKKQINYLYIISNDRINLVKCMSLLKSRNYYIKRYLNNKCEIQNRFKYIKQPLASNYISN